LGEMPGQSQHVLIPRTTLGIRIEAHGVKLAFATRHGGPVICHNAVANDLSSAAIVTRLV
jgi:hypothetical protein